MSIDTVPLLGAREGSKFWGQTLIRPTSAGRPLLSSIGRKSQLQGPDVQYRSGYGVYREGFGHRINDITRARSRGKLLSNDQSRGNLLVSQVRKVPHGLPLVQSFHV